MELGVSEPSVKRLFATQRLTLDRLIEISHLVGFTLAELTQEAALGEQRLHTLEEAQERELVADEKLLLVAVCVLNQWTVGDIVQRYCLTEADCAGKLVKLDRLGLIRLLPDNRVRLNVARDFGVGVAPNWQTEFVSLIRRRDVSPETGRFKLEPGHFGWL